MRVVVVGAGIGGLACAQGLVRGGFDVVVVERDSDLARTAGYKLHLGPPAVAALRALLPADLVEVLHASAVGTRGFSLAVRDHRGRVLVRVVEPSAELSLDVDRVTLRAVLAEGLGDRLRLGTTCGGWRREGDTVVAELDDGREEAGDLLVIADGAGSALAERLAGLPTSVPSGLVGVAGRVHWDAVPGAARALLAEPLLAVGPGGTGLFATAHDPAGGAAVRSERSLTATAGASAIWGLVAVEDALPPRPPPAHEDLVDLVVGLLGRERWATPLVDLVRADGPRTAAAFRLRASDPDHLAPWPSSRVTALGDAVHAMPPTGGKGAATAILDAEALVDRLRGARRGEVTAVMAVSDYETALRRHAAPAVRESLQPLSWIRATATPQGALLARGVLPVVAAGSAAVRALAGRRR
ncbi:FAD-dependent oxidoreductase [Umezawaea sp.]|uniref:FAD-dependent oxidoreductase n=1 Tax=Umezawaea sp. TaxID=1955258 RepID=UPI002ED12A4C